MTIRVTVSWEYEVAKLPSPAYPGCKTEVEACEFDRQCWEQGDVDITDLVQMASEDGIQVKFESNGRPLWNPKT